MSNLEKKIEKIHEELKKPLPNHSQQKEKRMATAKKSKKKVSKKSSKKVSKKSSKKVSKKSSKKVSKKVKARKEKKAVDGVTLSDLAKEAGVNGQKARQKLRAAGIEREKGSRWVFTNKTDEKAARKALGI